MPAFYCKSPRRTIKVSLVKQEGDSQLYDRIGMGDTGRRSKSFYSMPKMTHHKNNILQVHFWLLGFFVLFCVSGKFFVFNKITILLVTEFKKWSFLGSDQI